MNAELQMVRERLQHPLGLMLSGALLNAALADVFALVDRIAALQSDDDLGGDMSGDDAVSALSGLIDEARRLSVARPVADEYPFSAGPPIMTPCVPCHGTGEIIEYLPDDDERMVACPHCGGQGEKVL